LLFLEYIQVFICSRTNGLEEMEEAILYFSAGKYQIRGLETFYIVLGNVNLIIKYYYYKFLILDAVACGQKSTRMPKSFKRKLLRSAPVMWVTMGLSPFIIYNTHLVGYKIYCGT